jgi:universal stress protein A
MQIRKLLCPVDFSPASRVALLEAVDLARRNEAKLTIAHVMTPVPVSVPEPLLDTTYVARMYEDIDRELGAWRTEAESMGVRVVEARRLEGTPWDAITETARTGGHDVIVMSTHGRTGLEHALIGSVAEKVVRHAPCSVLVVRPKIVSERPSE